MLTAGPLIALLFDLLLLFVLVWASVVDWRAMILPNRATLSVAVLGLVRVIVIGEPNGLDAIAGLALGGGLLLATRAAFQALARREALGLGDVKLLAASGLWVGFEGIGPVLVIATVSALVAIILRALRTGERGLAEPLPFGPFLAFGIVVVVWMAEWLRYQPWIWDY